MKCALANMATTLDVMTQDVEQALLWKLRSPMATVLALGSAAIRLHGATLEPNESMVARIRATEIASEAAERDPTWVTAAPLAYNVQKLGDLVSRVECTTFISTWSVFCGFLSALRFLGIALPDDTSAMHSECVFDLLGAMVMTIRQSLESAVQAPDHETEDDPVPAPDASATSNDAPATEVEEVVEEEIEEGQYVCKCTGRERDLERRDQYVVFLEKIDEETLATTGRDAVVDDTLSEFDSVHVPLVVRETMEMIEEEPPAVQSAMEQVEEPPSFLEREERERVVGCLGRLFKRVRRGSRPRYKRKRQLLH